MDFIRSCYATTMVFQPGGAAIPVRWYFAPKGAKLFPRAHAFFSRNWEDKGDQFDTIGEQPGLRPWRNGIGPNLVRGDGVCASVEQLSGDAVTLGSTGVDIYSNGVPVCCVPEESYSTIITTIPGTTATSHSGGCFALGGIREA